MLGPQAQEHHPCPPCGGGRLAPPCVGLTPPRGVALGHQHPSHDPVAAPRPPAGLGNAQCGSD
jgi:hypothetical protein